MATVLDIDVLAAPVPGDLPAGPDLAYDLEFGAFERSALPKPEQIMGEKTIPAEEPDWSAVLPTGKALLGRTKDLRLAVPVTEAATRLHGIPGFAAGMGLIQRLLASYWDGLHPALDAEDNNDPTERVNHLMGLVDAKRCLGALRLAPLVVSRAAGKFSFRDCQIASGEMQAPVADGKTPPDSALIAAAFSSAELEALTATAAALANAKASLGAIETLLADKLATSQLPEFEPLADVLKGMTRLVNAQLAQRGISDDSTEADGAAAGSGGSPGRSAPGEIRNRDDVGRMLDRLCYYFEQNEPSSPIPLLLRRAKRLVTADFMTIIRDLTPSGASEAESIAGKDGGQ